MNRLRITITFILWVGMAFSAPAQMQDPGTHPKNPILPRAPMNSCWAISYEHSALSANRSTSIPDKPTQAHQGSLVQTLVEKYQDGYHEIHHYASNPASEMWQWHGIQLFSASDKAAVIRLPAMSEMSSDYSRSDFEILEWIGPENFVGKVSYKGKPSFFFRTKKADKKKTPREIAIEESMKAAGISLPAGDQIITAWIDAETQFPLAYEEPGLQMTYTFNPQPVLASNHPSNKFTSLINQLETQEVERSKYRYAAP